MTSPANECGLAMLALLVVATLVALISISLIGVMTTDMAHATIQYAVARAFYIAQAGLEEAKAQVSAAADPSVYAMTEWPMSLGWPTSARPMICGMCM